MELFFLNAKSAVYNVSVLALVILGFKPMKNDSSSCCFSTAPRWFTVFGPLQHLSSADSGCGAQFSHSAGWNAKQIVCKSRKTQGFILRKSRGYCRATQRRFYVCISQAFPTWAAFSACYLSFILLIYHVSQGIIEVESENVFKLAANALQVSAF